MYDVFSYVMHLYVVCSTEYLSDTGTRYQPSNYNWQFLMKAYTEFVDFIITGVSPQQILAFRPSEETRERVRYLLAMEKSGTIS